MHGLRFFSMVSLCVVSALPITAQAAESAYEALIRLAREGRCSEAEKKLEEYRRDAVDPKTGKPLLAVRLAEARVLRCAEKCVEAKTLIDSYLRESTGIPDTEPKRKALVASGGFRDEVDACIARHKRTKWLLIGGIVGGVVIGAAVTVPLVLRYPPATSPAAGAAMSSPALQVTVRF